MSLDSSKRHSGEFHPEEHLGKEPRTQLPLSHRELWVCPDRSKIVGLPKWLTIHLEIVEAEARLCGARCVRKRAVWVGVRKASVLLTYQVRARTGHQTLSSLTEEKEEIFGIKIGCGRKSTV